MTQIISTISDTELADISALLGDLEMPDAAVADAAMAANEVFAETDTIYEPGEDDAEIAAAVDAIEAEGVNYEPAAEPILDLSALDSEIEDAVRDLELIAARDSAYASQEALAADPTIEAGAGPAVMPEAAGEASEATTTKPAKPAKEAKAPKEPKTPAAPRATLGSLPAEAFILDASFDVEDAAAIVANRTAVMARRPEQVKVAEKFDNTLLAIAAGKLPSTYTVDCYRVLKASGETTSAALAAALTSTDKKGGGGTYTIGTARSQAGQFMALSVALKIAKREGNKLILNPDSLIAMALDGLMGA